MRRFRLPNTWTWLQVLSIIVVLGSSLLVIFTHFATLAQVSDLQLPYIDLHSHKQKDRPHDSRLVVDLGYEIYQGVHNATTGLNIWKGIRFASPPLRWQPPSPPSPNRTQILPATSFGPACPHTLRAGQANRTLPSPISEDCLFLNIYAPANASGLPVFVHIHGGGYGVGDGREDLSGLMKGMGGEGVVGVGVQYRLGAFGFLAGEEVKKYGVLNAGLLDQQFALEWVQKYIGLFGGDMGEVTVFGVSAGGGSVMLHTTAYGGTQSTSLFSNSISFSPYLPPQHHYAAAIPTRSYLLFATHAGCFPPPNSSTSIFSCLSSASTANLQAASNTVSRSGNYGTWAFVPVTDGTLVPRLPSVMLGPGARLNGRNCLTSNVAEEGWSFVPRNITSSSSLHEYIRRVLPGLDDKDKSTLYTLYNYASLEDDDAGVGGEGALHKSATSSGYQSLANLIYSETTFICPSYWLAAAHNNPTTSLNPSRKGWKMQYSILPALHGYDGLALFGNNKQPFHGEEFVSSLQKLIGDFVRTGELDGEVAEWQKFEGKKWKAFKAPDWAMLNLNQTGGLEMDVNSTLDPELNGMGLKWIVGPGLRREFGVVDGWNWEQGRGERCGFWKGVGEKVGI